MQDVDVLVVGGAIAGLTTALLAAHHGLSVRVVEKHAATSPHPRARSYAQRSMELLRGTPAHDALVRAGAMTRDAAPRFFVGETLATAVERPAPPPSAPTEVSPSPMLYLGQDRVEPILAEAARALGADVRFGCALEDWRDDGDRIVARVGGAELSASYMIAADGVRSPIRERLGIARRGDGSIGYQVAALVEMPVQAATFAVLSHPEAGGVLVATDVVGRYVYSVRDPGTAIDDARWTALLRIATGDSTLAPRILGTFPWEAAERWAERFRDGRVFLVGDAAHQMVPAGGFGANTAIHGAANLAWKLAWVIRGEASPRLLDSYDAERRPVAIATAQQATARGMQMMRQASTTAIATDDAVMFGARYGAEPAIPLAFADDGAVGTRVPHAWLAEGRSTLDVAGRGCAVIAIGDGWLVPDGVPLAVAPALAARTGLSDGALLVRPDGIVAARWDRPVSEAAIAAAIAAVRAG